MRFSIAFLSLAEIKNICQCARLKTFLVFFFLFFQFNFYCCCFLKILFCMQKNKLRFVNWRTIFGLSSSAWWNKILGCTWQWHLVEVIACVLA